jgi:hypothetical protein
LLQVKARYIQGFLFSRPMPSGQIDAYLQNEEVRTELQIPDSQKETARTEFQAVG